MKSIFLCLLALLFAFNVSAKKNKTPIVGFVDNCPSGKAAVNRSYIDAMLSAGFMPIVFPAVNNPAMITKMVKGVDMVFVTGGEDVNPSRYGAAASPHLGEVNEARDEFEILVLEEAAKQKKPIFGTCRGLQVINVCFGGTLYQDLPTEWDVKVNHRQGGKTIKNLVHTASVEKGSRLYSILKTDSISINSSHHQAVKKLAPGFHISSISSDGVVEAIECDSLPIAAVQFHPEHLYNGIAPEFKKLYVEMFRFLGKK